MLLFFAIGTPLPEGSTSGRNSRCPAQQWKRRYPRPRYRCPFGMRLSHSLIALLNTDHGGTIGRRGTKAHELHSSIPASARRTRQLLCLQRRFPTRLRHLTNETRWGTMILRGWLCLWRMGDGRYIWACHRNKHIMPIWLLFKRFETDSICLTILSDCRQWLYMVFWRCAKKTNTNTSEWLKPYESDNDAARSGDLVPSGLMLGQATRFWNL